MLKLTTILFLITISTLAGIHLIALELYLYWHYVWFDIVMHFIGGAAVTLGIFAFEDLRIPPFATMARSFFLSIIFLFSIMFAWEVFEVWGGIPIEDNYWFDTALDTFMGFIGGLVGLFIGSRIRTL